MPGAPAMRLMQASIPMEVPRARKQDQSDMAKSQTRSNREVRKPKVEKPKASVAISPADSSAVMAAMRKPKGKL
jgi:hypothetical protein